MKKSVKINALLNACKQLLAVIYPMITITYVTRTLQEVNYGKLKFARSISEYFVLLAGLGLTNYAIREGSLIKNKKKDFKKFVDQIFSINLISMAVSYVVLFIFLFSSRIDKIQNNRLLILIYSIVILLNTIGTDWVNSIFEDYLYITVRYLMVQIICLISLFLFVKKPSDYYIYGCIAVFAQSGGNLFNLFYVRKYIKPGITKELNISKHFAPVLYLFASSVATTIYINSDITLIGLFCGEAAAGIYSAAANSYTVIKHILNSTITVTIPRLALYIGNQNKKAYQNLIDKIANYLAALIVPMSVGLLLMSKEVIMIVGGTRFISGVSSLRFLSVSLLFTTFSCFYTKCIMLPNRKDRQYLISTFISAILNVVLNLILIPRFGIVVAAFTTMISELVMLICGVLYTKGIIIVGFDRKNLFSIFASTCLMTVFVLLFQRIISSLIVKTLICVSGGVLVYVAGMLLMKNQIAIDTLKNAFNVVSKIKKRLAK